MNTSSKSRTKVLKTENPEPTDDGDNVKKPKRSILQRAVRYVREKLPKKKGSKKVSNYRSLPNLSTAEETAPQSFDVKDVQRSVEHVSAENDLIVFDETQPTALHIPFPGKSRRRASRATSVNAPSVVSGDASVQTSLTTISEILPRDSFDANVENNQDEEEGLFQSTAFLVGWRTKSPYTYPPTLVSKAQSVPELSIRMQNSKDCDVHYTKTLMPQANVSTESVANCDSAYVSASNLELNDTNSLSSSSESSETGSTSSSSSGEQESDEETQEEHTNRVAKYKKNSLSSTAPLVSPIKKSTKNSDKQKKENGHLQKEVADLVLKAIGKYTNDLGYLTEIVVGLQLDNCEQFGPQFTGSVKITSLYKAIKHVFKKRGGTHHGPDITARITAECIKIRDAFNPNDSDAENVTGIQKEILLWFLDRMKTYKHKISAKLDSHLNKFPWLGFDGRVSLKNVRTCIQLVHKDLRSTLAFLVQTIDWNNVTSFSSPRPKENKKGNACGHGWYFLIHHSLASHCKAVDASKADQEMLMPFPPSGEIELDVGGRIQIGTKAIQIEIGEIKTSAKGVQKGQIQLKRSLLISASLCHSIHAETNIPYILTGYVFVAGKKKKGDQRVFPEEQVFTPPGTLHCQVIYPSKYKSSPPTEHSTDSSC